MADHQRPPVELAVDAIQERILELTLGPGEDAGPPPAMLSVPQSSEVRKVAAGPPFHADDANATMTSTGLVVSEGKFRVAPDCNRSRPEGRRLFGLHNRDYPALWALAKLAEMTSKGPISVDDFYTEVLRKAWEFGQLLLNLEKRIGKKCTSLFPTNTTKRKAANQAFHLFAIGNYSITTEGPVTTSGPLFEWQVVGLLGRDEDLRIGLTRSGWDLLTALKGLSVEEPHPKGTAVSFLNHLAANAPADHVGFVEIVLAIGPDGTTRKEVCNNIAEAWPDWTPSQVDTNVAGYVARAREWGLVEPKQKKARYNLTQFGYERLYQY